jgi:hypothetical protein
MVYAKSATDELFPGQYRYTMKKFIKAESVFKLELI